VKKAQAVIVSPTLGCIASAVFATGEWLTTHMESFLIKASVFAQPDFDLKSPYVTSMMMRMSNARVIESSATSNL
jgi:hypothetical protein